MISRLIGVKNLFMWFLRMAAGKFSIDYSVKAGDTVYSQSYGWARVIDVNYVVLAVAIQPDGWSSVFVSPMWNISKEQS